MRDVFPSPCANAKNNPTIPIRSNTCGDNVRGFRVRFRFLVWNDVQIIPVIALASSSLRITEPRSMTRTSINVMKKPNSNPGKWNIRSWSASCAM